MHRRSLLLRCLGAMCLTESPGDLMACLCAQRRVRALGQFTWSRSEWHGPHQVATNRGRLAAVVRAAVADAPARRRAADARAADAEFARDFLAVRAGGLPRGLQHWPPAARTQAAAHGILAVRRAKGLVMAKVSGVL